MTSKDLSMNSNPPSLYDTSVSSNSIGKNSSNMSRSGSARYSYSHSHSHHNQHHQHQQQNDPHQVTQERLLRQSQVSQHDQQQDHQVEDESEYYQHNHQQRGPAWMSSREPTASPSSSSSPALSHQNRQRVHHPVVTASSSYSYSDSHNYGQQHRYDHYTANYHHHRRRLHHHHDQEQHRERHQNRLANRGPPRLTQSMDEVHQSKHQYAESDPGVSSPISLYHKNTHLRNMEPNQHIDEQIQNNNPEYIEGGRGGGGDGDVDDDRRPISHDSRQLHRANERYPKTMYPPRIEYASSDIGPMTPGMEKTIEGGSWSNHRQDRVSQSRSGVKAAGSFSPRRYGSENYRSGWSPSSSSRNYVNRSAVQEPVPPSGHQHHQREYQQQQQQQQQQNGSRQLEEPTTHYSYAGHNVETPVQRKVQELRRQLWNDDEILQVNNSQSTSAPTFKTISLSSSQDHEQGHEIDLYATTAPETTTVTDQPHSEVSHKTFPARMGNSGGRHEGGSNGRFHSKFYEAAIVARMRGESGDYEGGHPSAGRHVPVRSPNSHTEREVDVNRSSVSGNFRHEGEMKNEYETVAKNAATNSDRVPVANKNQVSQGRVENHARGRSFGPSRRRREPSPMIQERIRSLSQEPSSNNRGWDRTQDEHTKGPVKNQREENALDKHAVSGNYKSTIGRTSPVPRRYMNQSVDAHVGENWRDAEINDSGHVTEHSFLQNSQSSHPYQQWQQKLPAAASHTFPPPMYSKQSNSPDVMPSTMRSSNDHIQGHVKSRSGELLTSSGKAQLDVSTNTLSTLVEKLASVNRENPEEALAQIDSILRQERQKNNEQTDQIKGNYEFEGMPNKMSDLDHGTRLANRNEATHGKFGDPEEDDGDDDSDVSSITNPTFQEAGKGSRAQLKTGYAYGYHEQKEGIAKIPAIPSTSSFRRPRPSHLPNYSMGGVSYDDAMKTSSHPNIPRHPTTDRSPRHTGTTNPKSSRQFDGVAVDSGCHTGFNDNAVGTKDVTRTNSVEENLDFHDPNSPLPSGDLRANSSARSDQNGLTEQIEAISNQKVLAQKIRVWDNLSHGVAERGVNLPPQSNQVFYKNVSNPSPPPPGANPRRHPWDGKLPRNETEKVDVRNTSMTGEMGIETELNEKKSSKIFTASLESKTAYRDLAEVKERDSLQRPPSQDPYKHEPFKASRRTIKERSEGYLPVDPTYHVTTEEKKIEDSSHFNAMKPLLDETVDSSQNSIVDGALHGTTIPQFDPRLSEPRKMNMQDFESPSNAMSDPSSWVSLPPSSFFPETNQDLEPVSHSKSTKQKKPIVTPRMDIDKAGHLETISGDNSISNNNGRGNRKSIPPSTTRTRYEGQFTYPPSNVPAVEHIMTSKSASPRSTSGPVDLDDSVKSSTNRGSRLTNSEAMNDEVDDGAQSFDKEERLPDHNPSASKDAKSSSGDNGSIEVSLMDDKAYQMKSFATTNSSPLMALGDERRGSCFTPKWTDGSGKTKERRRGLLRNFIERSKARKKAGGSAATTGHSVTNQTTTSVASSAKSAVSTPNKSNLPAPTLRLIPPPPGVVNRDRRSLTPNRERNSGKILMSRSVSTSSLQKTGKRKTNTMKMIDKYYDDEV